MALRVSIDSPTSTHNNPNRDSLILLGYLVESLLFSERFVSCHKYRLSTSQDQGSVVLLDHVQSERPHQVMIVPWD